MDCTWLGLREQEREEKDPVTEAMAGSRDKNGSEEKNKKKKVAESTKSV